MIAPLKVSFGRETAGHRRSWREIDDYDFKLTPFHVIDELADGFLDHRSSPNHRSVLVYEEAHGHDAYAADFGEG